MTRRSRAWDCATRDPTPAGDGASGFGNTLLFLIVALIVTVTGVVIGLRRKERYPWLGYVVLALWVLPLLVMTG